MDAYTQGRQEAEQTITEYGIGIGSFLIEQALTRIGNNKTEDDHEYTRGLYHRMIEITEGKTSEDYMKPEQE